MLVRPVVLAVVSRVLAAFVLSHLVGGNVTGATWTLLVGFCTVCLVGFPFRLLGVCYGCFLRLAGYLAGRSGVGCVPMSGERRSYRWLVLESGEVGPGRNTTPLQEFYGLAVVHNGWHVYGTARDACASWLLWRRGLEAECLRAVFGWMAGTGSSVGYVAELPR